LDFAVGRGIVSELHVESNLTRIFKKSHFLEPIVLWVIGVGRTVLVESGLSSFSPILSKSNLRRGKDEIGIFCFFQVFRFQKFSNCIENLRERKMYELESGYLLAFFGLG